LGEIFAFEPPFEQHLLRIQNELITTYSSWHPGGYFGYKYLVHKIFWKSNGNIPQKECQFGRSSVQKNNEVSLTLPQYL
jgi:hypothetical protein